VNAKVVSHLAQHFIMLARKADMGFMFRRARIPAPRTPF
jgi:hypothetical protein